MNNLNEKLYKRFGLEMNLNKVRKGFINHVKNSALNNLGPILSPFSYEATSELRNISNAILKKLCRQLFLDRKDFNSTYGSDLKDFTKRKLGQFNGTFKEFLVKLQIFLNIVYDKFDEHEFSIFVEDLSSYLDDYPILGVKLKTFKTRSPKIIPITSKISDKLIEDVFGLLKSDKYKEVLNHFNDGLEEFLLAKNKGDLKDVVEDMLTACDEMVKIVYENNSLGLDHLFKKKRIDKIGISGLQKNSFGCFREYMHKIKHGEIKSYDRDDIEYVITLTSLLIKMTINKYEENE